MTRPTLHADDLWPLLKAGLSPALGTPAVQGRIKNALAQLPLLSGGGIECRLAPGSGMPLDLSLRTTHLAGGLARLAAGPLTKEAPATPEAETTWQRLGHFAAAHQIKEAALGRAVPEAWLEFDLEKTGAALLPNFFMRLDDHYGVPPLLGPMALARQQVSLELLKDALGRLGVKPQAGALQSLLLCLRNRPASASIKFVGVMLGRPDPGFRVTVADVPLSELTAYLRAIGWPADHRLLVPLIYFMERHVESVSLNLEISADVEPKIGLELNYRKSKDPAPHWKELLAGLVRLGLSSPDKAAAVQEWPGLLRRIDEPKKWPKVFSEKQTWLSRSINHVKLSYDPAPDMPFEPGDMQAPLVFQVARGIIAAKAYLAFNHPET